MVVEKIFVGGRSPPPKLRKSAANFVEIILEIVNHGSGKIFVGWAKPPKWRKSAANFVEIRKIRRIFLSNANVLSKFLIQIW